MWLYLEHVTQQVMHGSDYHGLLDIIIFPPKLFYLFINVLQPKVYRTPGSTACLTPRDVYKAVKFLLIAISCIYELLICTTWTVQSCSLHFKVLKVRHYNFYIRTNILMGKNTNVVKYLISTHTKICVSSTFITCQTVICIALTNDEIDI